MPNTINPEHCDDFIEYVERLRDGSIHLRYDPETGLRAVIVIDSTRLGPALGGCRCLYYDKSDDAVIDAMRLARGMTTKAAITRLPFGGGKTVIMMPKNGIQDRDYFFQRFGEFVESLNGKYITAIDSGTNLEDMASIAKRTKYVASLAHVEGFPGGDPSPYTAFGVYKGILAAVKHKLGRETVDGVHVAIQGVGHVGMGLAKLLHENGAKLTVADINDDHVREVAEEFGAKVHDTKTIHQVACDVYSPCALGACLNDETIPQIQAKIVAGAANNQLAEPRHDQMLFDKGILYAPDYAINAGGLSYATQLYLHTCEDIAKEKTRQIHDTMLEIFQRSQAEGSPTSSVADKLANEILQNGLD